MRDNEVLVARQPFLSKLLRKGKKMIGLRTNEADDLMARELESDDMLMAREYEDFLRRYFRSGI